MALLPIFIGCLSDAPRDNPLDPHNSSSGLTLQGTVFTFYQPFDLIPGALLSLKPGNYLTMTDEKGKYQFSNLPAGNYLLTCTATEYRSDSIQVELKQDSEINFHLDALPTFKQISLTTHHISRWFPPDDAFFIQFEVKADDRDGPGDINHLWYLINPLNFIDTLEQNSTPGMFSGQRFTSDFPVTSLHQLIGKGFNFFAEDRPGARVQSEPQFLQRIIDETPVLIAPTGLVTVDTIPIAFQWEPMRLPFWFSYKLEIFRIISGVPPVRVDEIAGISSESESFSYTGSLIGGDYFWILFVVDEFGNSSRSKEGSFRIP